MATSKRACPKCGEEIYATDPVCMKCGTAQVAQAAAPSPRAAGARRVPPSPEETPTTGGGGSKLQAALVPAGLVVVLVGGIVAAVLSSKKKREAEAIQRTVKSIVRDGLADKGVSALHFEFTPPKGEDKSWSFRAETVSANWARSSASERMNPESDRGSGSVSGKVNPDTGELNASFTFTGKTRTTSGTIAPGKERWTSSFHGG